MHKEAVIIEKIIFHGYCNQIRKALFNPAGYCVLTNRRFIYSKKSLAKVATLGAPVTFDDTEYDFAIPITDIVDYTIDKKKAGKNTLLILTYGNKEFQFSFNKNINWEVHFKNTFDALSQKDI